tara:strand:+ start:432 stop:914 length:483 start_codon:yes stop_codon:yes gene_type:complete
MDTKWIEEFEELEETYNIFYFDNISNIKLNLIYVDENNSIEHLKKDNLTLSENNKILQNELIEVIIRGKNLNDKKFTLDKIWLYNITIEPENLDMFIKNTENYDFLNKITNLNDINIGNTINMFKDLNTLIIMFKPYKNKNNTTKKIRLVDKKTKKTKSK